MKLPDTSNAEEMAHVGRMTVLRKARRETARKLRDRIVPILNAIENEGTVWDVSGVVELVEQINAINQAIADLN
jgi:hypothetical protein